MSNRRPTLFFTPIHEDRKTNGLRREALLEKLFFAKFLSNLTRDRVQIVE